MSIFIKLLLTLTLSFLSFFSIAQTKFIEGKHYITLEQQDQFTLSKQPEVVEFFYYGCPHCRNIHPLVEHWLKSKPPTVDFHYQPALYSPRIQWSAHLYYVAKVLNKENELQGEIFNRYFSGALQSTQDIYDLFASVGIDEKTVNNTYESFAVKNLLQKAKKLTNQSQIEGVPSFIVKGKYRVSSRTAGSPAKVFDVINYLLKNG